MGFLSGLLIVLFVIILSLIIYDAKTEQWKKRLNDKDLERNRWWWWTHWGLVAAVAAGAVVTAFGLFLDGGHQAPQGGHEAPEWLILFKEWAPHFGPELMVLAFAATFVEGALRKGEQRRGVRFRTVRSLMGLVEYSLNHHLFFEGGSSAFLEMERDAIERRSEVRKRAFWRDEQMLHEEAQKTAIAFIDEGLTFAWAVDRLDSERSRLRIDLLRQPSHSNLWSAIVSLENNVRAVFHRVPLELWRPNDMTIDDLLDKDRREDWEEQTQILVKSLPLVDGKRLNEYFMNDWEIMKLRVGLLNKFTVFQRAAISFRDRVWDSDDPDE